MTRDGFKWNLGPPRLPPTHRDIGDKLADLRQQVHSLTVENARLRALLDRKDRKSQRKPTRREKEQGNG